MKIYIAAPYPLLDYCRTVADDLKKLGFEITSRWLNSDAADEGSTKMDARASEENAKFASIDLDDLVNAQVVLLINPAEWKNSGTGGRHFELGVAYAIRRDIIILGIRSHIFHYLPEIITLEKFDDVVHELKARRDNTATGEYV